MDARSQLDTRAGDRPEGSISRRHLLGLTGAVGGATVLGWFLGVDQAAAHEAPGGRLPRAAGGAVTRVVVLGGGLAGLTAAYNLTRSGYEVVLLEAQEVVGGRVKTIREPFVNGGYAEAGALRIFDVHQFTNKYVKEFRLDSKLFEQPDAQKLWYLFGKRFTTPKAGELWPIEQMSAEERRDPSTGLTRYLGPGFEKIGDIKSPAWPRGFAGAEELDKSRLGDYARGNGASEGWMRYFAALEGDLFELDTAQALAVEAADAGASKTFGLHGGNDQLPKAFAAALGERVRYSSSVTSVVNDISGVTVGYRDRSGRGQQIVADYCVCAIPFPVLKRLQLSGFADEKMRAINEYQLLPLGRVYFQTKSQFWRNDPLGQLGGLRMIGTDTMADRIWNTSEIQGTPEGMLQAYLGTRHSMALREIAEHDRAGAIKAEVVRFLPALQDQVIATYSKLWQEDPFALGAVAFAQPGQLSWILDASRRPDKRTFFAGEHTGVHVGWMNGAIQSGERVASEILAS